MSVTRRRLYIIAAIVLAACIAAGIVVRANIPHHKTTQGPPTPTHVVTHSTLAPSEKAVTPATYHSAAVGDQPSYIKLPTIHAEGYIQNVGIDQNGAVAAPSNVNLAGWYIDSLSPGQPGLSIIDGHVDGIKSPGIFYHLNKLAAGDPIEVDLANGQKKLFTVRSTQQLASDAAATALFGRNYQLSSQLNIITCGGTWNNSTHAYSDRIVVTAAIQ